MIFFDFCLIVFDFPVVTKIAINYFLQRLVPIGGTESLIFEGSLTEECKVAMCGADWLRDWSVSIK